MKKRRRIGEGRGGRRGGGGETACERARGFSTALKHLDRSWHRHRLNRRRKIDFGRKRRCQRRAGKIVRSPKIAMRRFPTANTPLERNVNFVGLGALRSIASATRSCCLAGLAGLCWAGRLRVISLVIGDTNGQRS